MTTFAYPLNVKGADTNRPSANFTAKTVMLVESLVTVGQYSAVVSGFVDIPICVAPEGSRVYNARIDKITPALAVSGTNLNVGWGATPTQVFAAVTAETAGMFLLTAPTTAQLSAMAVPFAADTTIVARVSTSGSVAKTAGEYRFYVELI